MANEDRRQKIEKTIRKVAGKYFSAHGPTSKLVTVTRVEANQKLSQLTIFVTILPDDNLVSDFKNLKGHQSNLRKTIGDAISWRKVPEVKLEIDANEKKRQQIDDALSEL